MKFFKNCATIEEVKKLYRELCKQNHPDRGGDTATMQEINKEYSFVIARIANGQTWSQERKDAEVNAAEMYKDVITELEKIPGIDIEICGNWLWITGQTKPVKEELKEIGCFWASKKEAWYYRTDDFKCKSRKKLTLDQIRNKYGSEKVKTNSPAYINK